MFRIAHTFLATALLCAGTGALAQTRVSLVAADRPDAPPCSSLDGFRLSPFGGLIATQWVGGVRLDGRPGFPPRATRDTNPALPEIGTTPAAMDGEDEADAILGETDRDIAPRDGRPGSPLAFVDGLYREKAFFRQQVEIGPEALRQSVASLPVKADSVLEPGPLPLRAADAKPQGLTVPLYPLHLQARDVRTGQRTAFPLTATWRGTDLLADLNFGYSPDLPEGVPDAYKEESTGKPRFFDLTLYVPVTDDPGQSAGTPYLLNGLAVHVSSSGITLGAAAESGKGTKRARATGGFTLEFTAEDTGLPAMESLALGSDLPPGVKLMGGSGAEAGTRPAPVDPRRPVATLRYAVGGNAKPIAFDPPPPDFPNAVAVCKAAPRIEDESVVHVFGAPPSATSRDGVLRLYAAAWTAQGQKAAAPELAVRLDPFPPLVPDAATGAVRRARLALDGGYAVDTRDLAPGLYRVRFPELFSATADYTFVVCLSREGVRGAVSLFTHHNRCDYRQGERIEVTAVLRAAEAVDKARGELVLTDEDGQETPVGDIVFSAVNGGTDSRMVSIPAGQFQPGRYLLAVRPADGSLIGHRLFLQIFPRELRTTWEGFSTRICETGPFRTTEGLCAYRTLQEGPVGTLQTPMDIERYTGQPALPVTALATCRRDPLFPVEEATARYDDSERTLAAALRFGVQHMPHGAWGLDSQTANWNPKHSYGESLDWMRRMYAQRTQIHREFASFGGFFMNWYPMLSPHYESHPPSTGFAEFEKATLQSAIQAAQGPLPQGWAWTKEHGLHLTRTDGTVVKETDILKEGVQHPLFDSPALRELVEWKLRGQRRRTQAFSLAYDAWTEVSRALGDWNYLSFVPVGWFRGPDYYPPLYFQTLPRVGIEAYTDWQVDPFMELFGIDYYGAGSGKPAWVQMMSGGRNMQIRQTFLSAARGAWGVGCDTGTAFPQGRAGEDARLAGDLMHRYGPWFMGMKPVSDVAIVRSLRQEAADAGAFADSGGRNGMIWFKGLQGELWSLYYNLLRSGYPAAFITEEEIAAGGLGRYKAVFLHRQRLAMPPALMGKFSEYVAGGGHVFRDPTSSDLYPGEKVELGPDESIHPDVGSSTHTIGSRYVWLLHNYLRCKPRMDVLLARLPPPLARADHHHIVTAALAAKDAVVLFAINDTMVPPEVQAKEDWFIQGQFTMTRKGRLFLDKPCYVYDLTEGGGETHVTTPSPDRPGTFAYPVEFLRSEGRILAVTERPVRDVRVKAQWLPGAGGDVLRVESSVLDDQGKPFAGALPFEMAIRDPQGREIKRLYRASGPGQPVEMALGRNLAAGAWTVTARELVTGRENSAVLDLAGARVVPVVQAEGKVLARRTEEIARFLAAKTSLTIVLDEGQPEAYRQAAETLATTLRQAGKTCDILQVDPLQVRDLPLRWRRTAIDSNVWNQVTRGEVVAVRRPFSTVLDQEEALYDHPNSGYAQPGARFALFRDVILLGSPRDNRLIADLHGTVNRPASAYCPGPGGALIQVTWDGFAPRFDALTIQAEDREGLEAGCAWVAGAAKAGDTPVVGDTRPPAMAESAAGATVRPLPNVQRDGFGSPIGAIQPIAEGNRLLVSLSGSGISGSAHFLLESDGRVATEYPDILGGLTPLGQDRFLQTWRDALIVRDRDLRPLWQLQGIGNGGFTVHPETLDIYLGGDNSIMRLDRECRTVWRRDLAGEGRTEADFLKPWKATVRAVSADGKRLLVSGHREQMYGNDVAGYEDAAVLLLETATGATLWRKPGIMIRDTACGFMGDRIVACNAGDSKAAPTPNLVLLEASGKVILDVPLAVKLARVQPFGKDGLALVQEAGGSGAGLFDLRAGRLLGFPVEGSVKDTWILDDRLVIATWDGRLSVFDGTMRPVQSLRLSSPAGAVFRAPDGSGMIVGTESGQVQWLDAQGKILRNVDLNPYNLMTDEAAWARRWLGTSLAGVPVREPAPWVGKPVGTLDKARPFAEVSANLVENGDFEQGTQGWTISGMAEGSGDGVDGKALRLGGSLSQSFACKPGVTHVLSLFQQSQDAGGLRVRVDFKGQKEPFQAVLPLSPRWEERTVSFRPPPGATGAVVTLTPEPGIAVVDRIALGVVGFRSRNLLYQKAGKDAAITLGDGDWRGDDLGGSAADIAGTPPEIRQTIPWVAHLAKASGQGEQPPRIVMPWMLLVDGRLSGHDSSWTGKPLPQGVFSDHAELSVTFAKPTPVNLVALYEDAADPARYTRRFAVFARTKAGVRLLGFRDNNQSPYNLLSFETVTAESLLYIWDGSGDSHVRLMEIEAYSAEVEGLD